MPSLTPFHRIVILGAGSVLWAPNAICQMARSRSTKDAEIILFDLDEALS